MHEKQSMLSHDKMMSPPLERETAAVQPWRLQSSFRACVVELVQAILLLPTADVIWLFVPLHVTRNQHLDINQVPATAPLHVVYEFSPAGGGE